MQRGTISHRGRHWVLRFWEYQIRNGVRVRVNVHKKLAPVGPAYPDKRSVESLAWKQLEPINTQLQTPESATPITEFIETVYLPMVKQFLRHPRIRTTRTTPTRSISNTVWAVCGFEISVPLTGND